jgi:hypothetical protein
MLTIMVSHFLLSWPGKQEKASEVVARVLYVFANDYATVDLSGAFTSDGCSMPITALNYFRNASRGVVTYDLF